MKVIQFFVKHILALLANTTGTRNDTPAYLKAELPSAYELTFASSAQKFPALIHFHTCSQW